MIPKLAGPLDVKLQHVQCVAGAVQKQAVPLLNHSFHELRLEKSAGSDEVCTAKRHCPQAFEHTSYHEQHDQFQAAWRDDWCESMQKAIIETCL